jgi:uncharacterized coiled-coil DUF342 family protein
MLAPEERAAVRAQLDELQLRIKALRQRLKELHDQKEKAFHQRSALSKEISQHIMRLKQHRQERDALTDEVKQLKGNRSGLSGIIKGKIDEAKQLNAEKRKTTTKLKIKDNPSHLKMLMDKLETRIETEGLSFEKEKEIMKEIKELKKRYEAASAASTIWYTSHQLSKDIDTLKHQADDFHRQLQKKAQASQEKHELLMQESKQVDELKKKADAFGNEVDAKKAEIKALRAELDALAAQERELYGKISAERKEKEVVQKQERAKKFSEKLAEVKEKMKRGGKLTTEDIIVLQGER